MDAGANLLTVFVSSFLSATLLPASSEIVLFAFLQARPSDVWVGITVATLGNTIGGLTSYAIGRLIPGRGSARSIEILQRYGSPALLLSWVPIIGDALCVAAGWLRIRAGPATLFMALGKLARYAVLAAVIV